MVFQKALSLDPEVVTTVVLAACVLHNFFRSKVSSRQENGGQTSDQATWKILCSKGAIEIDLMRAMLGMNFAIILIAMDKFHGSGI